MFLHFKSNINVLLQINIASNLPRYFPLSISASTIKFVLPDFRGATTVKRKGGTGSPVVTFGGFPRFLSFTSFTFKSLSLSSLSSESSEVFCEFILWRNDLGCLGGGGGRYCLRRFAFFLDCERVMRAFR